MDAQPGELRLRFCFVVRYRSISDIPTAAPGGEPPRVMRILQFSCHRIARRSTGSALYVQCIFGLAHSLVSHGHAVLGIEYGT